MARPRKNNPVDPVLAARSQLGVASRRGHGVEEARAQLKAAKLEKWIQEALDTAPPLTDQQRDHLSALLSGGAK